MAWRAVLIALALVALSCRGKAPPRPAVPSASASAGREPDASDSAAPSAPAVDSDGGVGDARFKSWFPSPVAALRLDPNADKRLFGSRTSPPLADAADLLGLDAERIEHSGMREVLAVGYVAERDDGARVAASILCFGSPELAFAFYTARIAAASELGRTLTPFTAGAAAVLGDAMALAVRAETVVRLDYTNPKLPPESVAGAAAPVLRALATSMAAALPGEAVLPPAARLLPEKERLPLSLRYDAVDLVGFEGAGPGALASYADGDQRYRLALAVRVDVDAAGDVLQTLRKREGSRVLKRAAYDAIRVAERDPKDGAVREWIFGQKGVLVAGVALDTPPRAAPRGAPPERDRAILKLKRLLDALPARAPW